VHLFNKHSNPDSAEEMLEVFNVPHESVQQQERPRQFLSSVYCDPTEKQPFQKNRRRKEVELDKKTFFMPGINFIKKFLHNVWRKDQKANSFISARIFL